MGRPAQLVVAAGTEVAGAGQAQHSHELSFAVVDLRAGQRRTSGEDNKGYPTAREKPGKRQVGSWSALSGFHVGKFRSVLARGQQRLRQYDKWLCHHEEASLL